MAGTAKNNRGKTTIYSTYRNKEKSNDRSSRGGCEIGTEPAALTQWHKKHPPTLTHTHTNTKLWP